MMPFLTKTSERYSFAAYMPTEMTADEQARFVERLDAIPGKSERPKGVEQIYPGLGYIATAEMDGTIVGCINVTYRNFPNNEFVPFGLHSAPECEQGLARFARSVAAHLVRNDPFTAANLAGIYSYRYNGREVAK